MVNKLLYLIPAKKYGKNELVELLQEHPEIRFVSLVGVDLAVMIQMKKFQSNHFYRTLINSLVGMRYKRMVHLLFLRVLLHLIMQK